jgi:flavodoxin
MTTSTKKRRRTPLIVFQSRTDNTRRVAEAIAKPLGAELVTIDQLKNHQLRGRALIGLGSGVYWLRLERRIVELAARIPAGARVFIFSTSSWQGEALTRFFQSELVKQLKERDIELIGRWHCPGQDKQPLFRWLNLSRGRPDTDDLRRAREFARGLPPME